MTLDTFRLLAPRVQVTLVLLRGTHLANRSQKAERFTLYHLQDGARGFFIELGYNSHYRRTEVRRTFSDSASLEEYVQEVQLPAEL